MDSLIHIPFDQLLYFKSAVKFDSENLFWNDYKLQNILHTCAKPNLYIAVYVKRNYIFRGKPRFRFRYPISLGRGNGKNKV